MDGVRTQQNRELSSRLGVLSNAIAGGPYIGLLGMAAALLATAMGLFVAIPALFAYNRLNGRNRDISSDMRVFLDEFVTRLAEIHATDKASPLASAAHHDYTQTPVT